MFTLEDIQNAHAKVKSGSDFPFYIKEIKDLGIRSYVTFVSDSHTEYRGDDDFVILSKPKYASLSISSVLDKETFVANLKKHQQRGSDYMSFCQDCADAGIAKRVVSMEMMSCAYYDLSENEVLVEMIPSL